MNSHITQPKRNKITIKKGRSKMYLEGSSDKDIDTLLFLLNNIPWADVEEFVNKYRSDRN